MLFLEREKQYPFSSHKLGMQNVRQVNVKMQGGNRSGTSREQHGVFFYKPRHQVIGPAKVLCKLRRMVKNVEQKNSPSRRSRANHVNILSQGLVIICRITRC